MYAHSHRIDVGGGMHLGRSDIVTHFACINSSRFERISLATVSPRAISEQVR